ncbi:hypothetical protein [Flagellimonas okinawensis]|uniref:Membrane metalloprotease n=1 Tax=Flagellimonas okinawensis TaxID=3031324 RepID=A0ABT5XM46_9FLAO|nr:hypothetical protein [[Muricauda] okinawensis]MDF0706706.1 hypothetical protein [[Muricauda] okinawensis]
MKKIALITLLSFGLLLSCSKDSDVTSSPDSNTNLKAGNLLTTGASARDLLSNDNFDKLLIEIDYVTGFAPTAGAIANFEEFLLARTFKQTIEFRYSAVPATNEESLTLQEVVDLEEENRNEYNNGSTLAVHIFFADAPSEGDADNSDLVTLGAVYRNTSMVIYESTVKQMASSSAAITTEEIETATLLHEFGHLFGLVNLSTQSVNDHEDAEAENHCNVDGCLMRAEIQFGASLLKQMQQNASKGLESVPDIGPECLLDLQKYGGR